MTIAALKTEHTNTLEFKVNYRIPSDHHEILAAILNESWGWLIEADSIMIRKRLDSGSPIVVAYDEKKSDDKISNLDLSKYLGKIPIVVLEAIPIITCGDYGKVPKLFSELTYNGDFGKPPENPDTVLLLDLTAIHSRRGKNGQGVTKTVINFAKDLFSGKTDYDLQFDPGNINHIWTCSPDLKGIVNMHIGYGATDTGFTIPDFRNSFKNGLRNLTKEVFDKLYLELNQQLYHARLMSYKD